MRPLSDLILANEDWLTEQILHYAKERDYTQYTSTLAQAWRTSINGLSEALVKALSTYDTAPELSPDEDFTKDPMASFGILEAQLHRARGISLSMFLGLMKYYRQAYVDLLLRERIPEDRGKRYRLFIDRFFDRVELGFTEEWARLTQGVAVEELQGANRLLTNEKNKYLTVLESLASAVIVLDARNEIENMNHAAMILFGVSDTPGAFYYTKTASDKPLEWIAQDLESFTRHPDSELAFEKPMPGAVPPRHFEIKLKRMLDVSGKFMGTVVMMHEITERKSVQAALEESLLFLETLLDAIPNPVFFKNLDEKYLISNRAFSELVGIPKEDLVGASVKEVAPPEWAALSREDEMPFHSNRRLQMYETSVLHLDGTSREVLVFQSPFLDSHGVLVGVIGIILDITELRRAEREREHLRAQLFQSQKMEAIGTLSGGIAHDFNNMLTIILGYAELILAEKGETDPCCQDLKKIVQTGRKGAELVQRLLAFSREAETNPIPLDLNQQILNLQKLLIRTMPRLITVDLLLASELPMVNADPVQIDQILMNLAINAQEAMPDGGTLTIQTSFVILEDEFYLINPEVLPGPYVRLRVSDTGRGMDPATQSRIFDPFYTTKGWDSRKGTGLGLPVVHGIVEQHGGCIECFSELGKGTTLNIYLPALETDTSTSAHPESSAAWRGTETILLVDDEELVREVGDRILRRSGYTVLTAADGKHALDVYKREQEKISLVILDLIMPVMGGDRCFVELVKINPRVKVILSTGYSTTLGPIEAVEPQAKAFVKKPYDIRQLLQAVREVLDQP